MQRIKKGDKVRVIAGKYATKEGTVLLVNNKKGVAVIEGLNKVKMHRKPNAKQEKGGIQEKEAGIPLCKLALLAPKAPQGISKIKYTINKEGKKVRIAKKTNHPVGSK
ncbi:MAG: 50S ribosomal protein L24 [Mycoplasmataceae bacterium]|jgi:large subunit ribosomal protein L24|nr:50S ribosomal protein L24 [Mycoplasmataceae bacterium]